MTDSLADLETADWFADRHIGIAEAAALHKAVVEYSAVASGTFDFTKLTQELLQETVNEPETTRQLVVQSE